MYTTVHLSQDSSKISRYISTTLLDQIEETLKAGEKVLLYLNKRGSYSSLICDDCQHLFECPNCDTSLSVHSQPAHLLCHLCGHRFDIPLSCSNCSGNNLSSIGVGTQQIEEALGKYFRDMTPHPGNLVNIYRFDSDSMKNVSSKKAALQELEKADIIIGTKMITTGFDFEKVGCIGVILVEQELAYPSYDAEEKAYANLKQLIGRGNRKSQYTNIIFQTFIPKNPIIQRITNSNFKDFFTETLTERKAFLYPPYAEMVTLEYRHLEKEKAFHFMQKLEQKLLGCNSESTYQILVGTTAFKKNNTYHISCIIKGPHIREYLKNIENIILRESNLSVIFH